jgi:predicted RNase H-like nuclease (RuvC/YqgF family)
MGKNIAVIGLAVAVVALAVMTVIQQQTIGTLRHDNDELKALTAQLAPLQQQLDQAHAETAAVNNSTESQKHELVRLRNEVTKLREDSQQLAHAQQQIQNLNQQVASEDAVRNDQAAALQGATQKLQGIQQQQNANACINNLRLIDSAKQQWALEFRKTSADTPTWDDLRQYIGRGPNGDLPTCPEGGTYSIGTIAEKPTCSIKGHVLQ